MFELKKQQKVKWSKYKTTFEYEGVFRQTTLTSLEEEDVI